MITSAWRVLQCMSVTKLSLLLGILLALFLSGTQEQPDESYFILGGLMVISLLTHSEQLPDQR